MLESILTPNAAPMWALTGAIIVKLIDYLLGKKRITVDEASAQLGHLNQATKNLIDGLLKQNELMARSISHLEEEIVQLRADLGERTKVIKHLEDEIASLRKEIE